MTPRQAMRATGHGPVWVSRQTGLERTYLDRLCNGERVWTPELRKAFALAIGLAEDSIIWPHVGYKTTGKLSPHTSAETQPADQGAAV